MTTTVSSVSPEGWWLNQSASTSNTVPLRTYNRLVGTAGRLDSLHVGVYLLQPLAITAGPSYCPPNDGETC